MLVNVNQIIEEWTDRNNNKQQEILTGNFLITYYTEPTQIVYVNKVRIIHPLVAYSKSAKITWISGIPYLKID